MAPGPTVQTGAGRAPVLPLGLLIIGGYLAWFGVHYFGDKTSSGPLMPTEPVKAVLQGKPLPQRPATKTTAADVLTADVQTFNANTDTASGGGAATGPTGTAPAVAGDYSHAQLEQLWTASGGSSGTANVAAAIAQAESSGNKDVTSSNPDGGTNVGLWQLDTKGKGAGYTVAQLQDPTTNAHVAIMGSSNGTDWSAWATYASGAYRKFLSSSSGVTAV